MKYSILITLSISTFVLGCPRSTYKNVNGECIDCESGYYCPGDEKRYKCTKGFYSTKRQSKCQECGCDDCYSSDLYDETRGIMIHYAGGCTKEKGLCYPGYGMNHYTNSCHLC